MRSWNHNHPQRKKRSSLTIDLRISIEEHFIEQVEAFNRVVFDNGLTHVALRADVFNIKPQGIDLVYLDPPFNSQENYNVLFKERSGAGVGAQVEAFRDTWKWEDGAANAYEDVMRFNGDVALVLKGYRTWLHQSPMMAYLAMMGARLRDAPHVKI